jgi:hypothetical protein
VENYKTGYNAITIIIEFTLNVSTSDLMLGVRLINED